MRTDVTGVDIRDRKEGDHDFVGTSQTTGDICSPTADILANKSLSLFLLHVVGINDNREHTRNMGNFMAVRKLVNAARVP